MSFCTPTEVDVENLASLCSTVILALALKLQNRERLELKELVRLYRV